MKQLNKTLSVVLVAGIFFLLCMCFTSCNNRHEEKTLRFAVPEGTPALTIARLPYDNKKINENNMEYAIVNPSNIAAEMSGEKADLIIMPINAGANLIRMGAKYKLIGIAVKGSLFIVGKSEEKSENNIENILGKKIACIGKNGVPGLVFRYIMQKKGITIIESGTPNIDNNEIFVQYVADANAAKTLMANGSVDLAVVGEPAATILKSALKCNVEIDLQFEYSKCNHGIHDYPQAGLFIKQELSSNKAFSEALFSALKNNKEWVMKNTSNVTDFCKTYLYKSANFPATSIPRCALYAEALSENDKIELLSFLESVSPKDAQNNSINWQNLKELLFA